MYVPADYLKLYEAHDFWGSFDMRPIEAGTTQTDNLQVTPAQYTADVVWSVVSGADTYELIVRNTIGAAVRDYFFNDKGQLQLAFGAPGHGKAPEQTMTDGFSFTVTGLDEGTPYVLIVDAINHHESIQTLTLNFTTLSATGLDAVETYDDTSLSHTRL